MSWYNKFKGDSKKSASSFWYDDYNTSYDYLDTYSDMDSTKLEAFKKTNDLYKLSATRRAIANFVQIVTQKNIPVTFASKSSSQTDGKQVILSADVNDNFDVSVGLALHEGSHIVLSDFKLLEEMGKAWQEVEWAHISYENSVADPAFSIDYKIDRLLSNLKYYAGFKEMYLSTGKVGSYGKLTYEINGLIGNLTNWIEDRRIDYHIFTTAPGYRDYYTSMYDYYFNDKVITKGVISDEYTDENFESYMFRIINLHNEKTDLSKLKGLRAIYRMIDLKNIGRLKSTEDAFMFAIYVMSEILKYVPISESESEQSNGENGEQGNDSNGEEGEGGGSGDEKSDEQGGVNASSEGIEGEESDSDSDSDSQSSDSDTKGNPTKSASKQLSNKFQKQKDFLNNKVRKKKLQKGELVKLENINESGTEMVRVGNEYVDERGRPIGKGVDCIVVKNLTEALINDESFPFSSLDWSTKKAYRWAEEEVKVVLY
jgi:hypothetical protein